MSGADRYDILFQPLQVGPKLFRNRFYAVPQCTGFGSVKPRSQAAHRGMKAEGGWAAVNTEFAPVSYDSESTGWASSRLVDDDDLGNLSATVEAIHRFQALAGIELVHCGVYGDGFDSRWVSAAPTQLANPLDPLVVPKTLEAWDLERIQEDWVRAAIRARSVGFDIIYVYAGESYLPMQFLSPFYNKRNDSYGGDLFNRARFWLETLRLVRDAVGGECVIATRLALDELFAAGGSDPFEFVAAADELVDLWDVKIGPMNELYRDSGSSRFFPEGSSLKWFERFREYTSKPLVGVSRWTNPDRMAAAVRSGVLDLIGAARPSIADPFIPEKVRTGRLDDIRECIGCNICVVTAGRGNVACTQNATTGEEYRRGWHPEVFAPLSRPDADVLVVGAGPAGMECAIVLGKRGCRRVHLVDAAPEAGGSINWISRLPGLGEWRRLVDWRVVQLKKLRNVEMITSLSLTGADAWEYGADIVVVATGARWASDGLNYETHDPIVGADALLPYVLTPEQIMVEQKRPTGERVVVFDAEGYFMGAGLAELLAIEGHRVELITNRQRPFAFCEETREAALLRSRMHELEIAVRTDTRIDKVKSDHVICSSEFGEQYEIACDSVVLVTQRLSNDGLYLDLSVRQASESFVEVYRAGDCVAPRLIADAIFDGHRLGREIDSPSPRVPLPHIRERSVVVHEAVLP